MYFIRRVRNHGGIEKKKLLSFILIIVIASQFLVGCSNKNVEFKEFYSQVIGFSDNDEISKPVPQDSILMMTNDDFQQFKDTYFTPREIPMDSPDTEKAVLYLQITSPTSSVTQYSIKSIKVRNKTLTVSLKETGYLQVDAKGGFDGTWKWVMFLEIDKTYLRSNMKIVIKK